MSIYIATVNYLDDASFCCVSSEDTLYIAENLYNARPSKPFRFTGNGAIGAPEWICIQFAASQRITLVGIFNHNLTDLGVAGDSLILKGCDDPCEDSGACDWDGSGVYPIDMEPRLLAVWNDLYQILDESYLSWRVEFIDQSNPFAIEIGELFLSEYEEITNAHLQPGREESPILFRRRTDTDYGQHWSKSLAYAQKLNIKIKNINDPAQVDQLQRIILEIHEAEGKCVIIPNSRFKFAYYAYLENEANFTAQITRGTTCELKEWTLQFRTLTKGIALL